jgi:predicted dehydrogenase
VVGVGAFGRNHARVYRQLAAEGVPVELVAVVDSDTARADAVAQEFDCRAFGSIEQLTTTHREIQAASVAVPTVHHLEAARQLMEAGIDLLIEKPVATSLGEVDELISLSRKLGRIVQIGHLERFNPAVRAVRPVITQPMFFEVHRLSVFTPRSLDVDVVLDLMIHDLDIVLSLVNSEVREIRAVGLPILSGKVDIANVRLEFESGCVANFTASRVSTERVRKMRFFQPRQYISLDYSRQDALVFSVGDEMAGGVPSVNPQIQVTKLGIPAGSQTERMSGASQVTKLPPTREEPLHAELKSLVECVRQRSEPEVGLVDGRRALSVALDILAAIQEHGRKVDLERLSR